MGAGSLSLIHSEVNIERVEVVMTDGYSILMWSLSLEYVGVSAANFWMGVTMVFLKFRRYGFNKTKGFFGIQGAFDFDSCNIDFL